jgi:hypothetical protein
MPLQRHAPTRSGELPVMRNVVRGNRLDEVQGQKRSDFSPESNAGTVRPTTIGPMGVFTLANAVAAWHRRSIGEVPSVPPLRTSR